MCMVGLWAVFGLRHIERLLFGWLAIKWLWWMVPDLPERIVMVLLLRYVGFFEVGLVAYRIWAGHRTDRKSVVPGKSVSVRVARGGSRNIKKKKTIKPYNQQQNKKN